MGKKGVSITLRHGAVWKEFLHACENRCRWVTSLWSNVAVVVLQRVLDEKKERYVCVLFLGGLCQPSPMFDVACRVFWEEKKKGKYIYAWSSASSKLARGRIKSSSTPSTFFFCVSGYWAVTFDVTQEFLNPSNVVFLAALQFADLSSRFLLIMDSFLYFVSVRFT